MSFVSLSFFNPVDDIMITMITVIIMASHHVLSGKICINCSAMVNNANSLYINKFIYSLQV